VRVRAEMRVPDGSRVNAMVVPALVSVASPIWPLRNVSAPEVSRSSWVVPA